MASPLVCSSISARRENSPPLARLRSLLSLSEVFDRACRTVILVGESLPDGRVSLETAQLWDDACAQLAECGAAIGAVIGEMIDQAQRESLS